jgi:hypothetical protein
MKKGNRKTQAKNKTIQLEDNKTKDDSEKEE